MARPTNTDERREAIARALGRVMARGGYEGASIAAVAREAGLAPGLVHYHFADKEEILVTLVRLLAADARARFERRALRGGSHAAWELEAYVDSRLALDDEADPSVVAAWVAIAAEALRRPTVRAAVDVALDDELALAERAARHALLAAHGSAVGSKALAAAVVASVQGYYVLATLRPEGVPPGSAAAKVRALARSLVAGEAASRKESKR